MDEVVTQPTLVGALAVAVAALASAVIALWRKASRVEARAAGERRLMAEERKGWETEREKLRADYHAQLATQITAERAANRANETQIRQEYFEQIEQLSTTAQKSADALNAVLQKFLDRFIGRR